MGLFSLPGELGSSSSLAALTAALESSSAENELHGTLPIQSAVFDGPVWDRTTNACTLHQSIFDKHFWQPHHNGGCTPGMVLQTMHRCDVKCKDRYTALAGSPTASCMQTLNLPTL